MSKRTSTPQLDGCEQMPLRFKEVPLENMSGQALGRCKMCDGSGAVCKGEKLEQPKGGATTPPKRYTPTSPATSVTLTLAKATPSPVNPVPPVAALAW